MGDKKILVSGATSFVGSNLVNRLVNENYDVHVLVRESSDKWRLSDSYDEINKHFVDLSEKEKLEGMVSEIQPDIIFHLATQGIYGGVHSADELLVKTNLIGTMNLINACNGTDYECFVNTGSSSEYGVKGGPMREDDACFPINMYGITKNASTQFGKLIAKAKNRPIVSLRLFSPFGPLDRKERFMSYAISNALQDNELMLGNPNSVRDYIFIEDVLDAYLNVMGKAREYPGEIFNIGSGNQSAISAVVQNILEITGSKSNVIWGESKPRDYDPKVWVAGIQKAKNLLDWEPRYNLKDGLEKTIYWFKNNLENYR